MTDERLKIWIDLLKWAVVSVGLVIMTKIIDAGFKDREVGINEIKEYDKYVSLVTDNTKISERRLLAQYFAHVTPSDKLKEGWISYYNTINEEYEKLLEEKEMKQQELLAIKTTKDSAAVPPARLAQLQTEIATINEELTPTFNKERKTQDFDAALSWERIGFENLINGNLDDAIAAFQKSESAYNSFHQVYEIGRFLRKEKETNRVQNDEFWQVLYKTLLKEYSWKMPADIKKQLEDLSK